MNTEWSKTTKYIAAVGMALFGLYLLYLSRSVLAILIIAALVAFLLMPVVSFLHYRIRMPRVLASLLSYLGLVAIVLLTPLILLPPVIDGFNVITGINYEVLAQDLFHWTEETLLALSQIKTPVLGFTVDLSGVAGPALQALRNTSLAEIVALPSFENVFTSARSALTVTLGVTTSLAGTLISGALTVILTFLYSVYLSVDADKLAPRFLRVVPDAYRPEIAILIRRLSVTWRAYFRGQISLMIIVGTITLIGNTALGLPGAFSLAVVAGVLELVPNLGPFLALVPAVVVALLQGSTYWEVNHFIFALMIMGFYLLVQQVENNYIVPRVLGGAVKLHPLVIMGGVIIGASAAGIIGALLAAPVIASGKEIMSYLYAKILNQDPFPPQKTPEERQSLWPERLQTLRIRWRQSRRKSAQEQAQPESTSGVVRRGQSRP